MGGTVERRFPDRPLLTVGCTRRPRRDFPLSVRAGRTVTLGNIFAAHCLEGDVQPATVKSGIEYMMYLADWYTETTDETGQGVGFFQIGGGIAGDFPICVVPMLHQDLGRTGRASLVLFLPDLGQYH